jgi:hypothetical protein
LGLVDYVVERPALENLSATLSLVAAQAEAEQLATIKRLCRGIQNLKKSRVTDKPGL